MRLSDSQPACCLTEDRWCFNANRRSALCDLYIEYLSTLELNPQQPTSETCDSHLTNDTQTIESWLLLVTKRLWLRCIRPMFLVSLKKDPFRKPYITDVCAWSKMFSFIAFFCTPTTFWFCGGSHDGRLVISVTYWIWVLTKSRPPKNPMEINLPAKRIKR